MAFLGTDADAASDVLILVEVLITAAVVAGILLIRRNRIKHHRAIMLGTLAANAAFLVGFLIMDAVKASTTLERGVAAPAAVFWPTLGVHLALAFGSFGVAIVAWRRARTGYRVDEQGRAVVDAQTRRFHLRVARYYPWLWGGTLVTGLLLYNVVYVFY